MGNCRCKCSCLNNIYDHFEKNEDKIHNNTSFKTGHRTINSLIPSSVFSLENIANQSTSRYFNNTINNVKIPLNLNIISNTFSIKDTNDTNTFREFGEFFK